jgi:dolichyl-phosphate-mannose-protein mannosyltransferase
MTDAPGLLRSITGRPYDRLVTATLEAPERAGEEVAPEAPAPPAHAVPPALEQWHDPHPWAARAVTLFTFTLACFTRLWALGFPQGKSFDEVYYATEAQEILRFGYEDNRGYMFIVHPPVGKLLIALSSQLWDSGDAANNSVGWRLAPAFAGIVSVVIITRLARRMFRSNLFGAIAGVLLALDGISLVQSRVALLDIFLQLFILAGFAALVVDRDQLRGRLAGLVGAGVDLSSGVPTLGPRPWRLVAGVMFALACSVKWSALSFYLLFALMSLWWDRGALKSAGVKHSWRNAARRSWIYAIGSLLITPIAVYLLSWIGWFAGENSWNRHWADSHRTYARIDLGFAHVPFNWGWVPSGVRSLGDYTYNAYQFHETLYSPHPYGSKPWSWLILGRPVTYYYPSNPTGCGAKSCAREILLIGTPLMWWAFLPALVWLAWHWFTTRDWRASVVWVAMVAGWLVWFPDLRRTMFLFYMTPLVPFLILGLTLALGTMLGPGIKAGLTEAAQLRAERRRRWGLTGIAVYLGLVAADFAWMWPLFTGGLLTFDQWHAHMWFPSWV